LLDANPLGDINNTKRLPPLSSMGGICGEKL
jgi:hypothetical protein